MMIFAPRVVVPLLLLPVSLLAQHPTGGDTLPATPSRHVSYDTSHATAHDTTHGDPPHYWRNFAAGFLSSILLHEAGHVVAAYAVGGHPYFGFDRGRPTIYSGIDATVDPHKQFLFSSAGLNVQAILDEGVLDIPHAKGSAFERGILAGGIATAYFYATLGRNASNSDITFMARTSSLSKTQASLIYAGLATIHVFRIRRDHHYADFFMRSHSDAKQRTGVDVGVALLPR